MELIIYLYTFIDAILMYFYRLPDSPLLGYFLGTFVLSVACLVIGKFSISISFRLNKERIDQDNHELRHFNNLSIKALKVGDKNAFKACNSIANDTYGKTFFSQIALSASSLWPIFIALGWLEYRFSEVEFSLPFSNYTFGYLSTFILCCIAARLFFKKIKSIIPS